MSSPYSLTEVDGALIDTVPDDASSLLTCEKCGKELVYSGRGRKPRFCPEDKPNRLKGKSGNSAPASAANKRLAEQAADVLAQYNDLMGAGLYMAGLENTASAIAERNSAFKAQAVQALSTDPGLSRMILSSGKVSGRTSLILAYALMVFGIVPIAMSELKERRSIENEPNPT